MQNNRFYSLLLIIIDIIVLLAAFVGAYILRVTFDPRPLVNSVLAADYLTASLVVIPAWIIIFASLGLYQPSTYNRRLAEWGRIVVGSFIGVLIIIGWEYVTRQAIFPARLVAVYALLGSCLLLILEREVIRFVRSMLFRYDRGIKRVLLIGNDSTTTDIASSLADTKRSGYKIVAIAGPKKLVPEGLHVAHYRKLDDAIDNIESKNVTAIIQANLFESPEQNQKVLRASQIHHMSYNFIPGEAEFYSGKNTIDVFLGYPMIGVHQTPLIGWGAILKRASDLVLVIVFSPIWLTILALLSVLQKLTGRGPVLFTSQRLGRYGKQFDLYKFRSMRQEYSGPDAIKIFKDMDRPDLVREYKANRKVVNDPRITGFGKFLRATSLDELPQLFNVLKGDMSLVGPRPILPDEKDFYRDRGALLFSVKPGITGLWQVSGRSDLAFESRVELELYYAQSWSYLLDIKIMLKTIRVVLFQRGAR